MRRAAIYLVLLLAVFVVLTGPVDSAAPGATYTLSWWTVDGGGGHSLGQDGYALDGTAGQPDPGRLENDGYTLVGGYWGGGAPATQNNVYLPLVMR